MERYGLRSLNFSSISDDDLDGYIRKLLKDFSFCGEQMLKFLLNRDIIHRVDQEGVTERK